MCVSCHVVLCYVVLCHVVLCHVVPSSMFSCLRCCCGCDHMGPSLWTSLVLRRSCVVSPHPHIASSPRVDNRVCLLPCG